MQLPYRKPGKYTHQTRDNILSQQKFEALQKKLDRLYAERPAAAQEVSRLAEMGDFSENVEYQLAKGRLRGINQTILELEAQLNHAQIISPQQDNNRVQIGHTVTIMSDTAEQRSYTILGSAETNPAKGIISHTSPLGNLLLGKKLGETITFNKKIFTIVEIN